MGVFLAQVSLYRDAPGASVLGALSTSGALKLKMDEDVCDDKGGYECRNRASPSGEQRRVRVPTGSVLEGPDGSGLMLFGTSTGLLLLRYDWNRAQLVSQTKSCGHTHTIPARVPDRPLALLPDTDHYISQENRLRNILAPKVFNQLTCTRGQP